MSALTWMTSCDVESRLTVAGLIGSGTSITEHPRSGRNMLWLVDSADAQWIVKQSLSAMSAEAWLYSVASGSLDFLPAAPLVVADHGLVVLSNLRDHATLQDAAEDDPIRCIEALVGLARPLLRLHTMECDRARAPDAILPVPSLHPVHIDTWWTASQAGRELITRIQERGVFRAVLGSLLDESLGPVAPIHGDIKVDNILQSPGRDDLTLIDWELAGYGPVAWDLGSVVGSMMVLWMDHLELNEDTDLADWIELGSVPFRSVHEAAQEFMIRYLASAAGPSAAVPSRDVVTAHAAAWILSRTWAEVSRSFSVHPKQSLRLLISEGLILHSEQLWGALEW